MGGIKEIYRDVRFFHGALPLSFHIHLFSWALSCSGPQATLPVISVLSLPLYLLRSYPAVNGVIYADSSES